MKFIQRTYALSLAALMVGLGLSSPAEGAVGQAILQVSVPTLKPVLRLSLSHQGLKSPIVLALRAEGTEETGAPLAAGGSASLSAEQEAMLLYRRALILQGEGQLKEAIELYERVIREFPAAPVVDGAALRLLELRAAMGASQPTPDTRAVEGTPNGGPGASPIPTPSATSSQKKANGGVAELLITESLLGGYAGVLGLVASQYSERTSVLVPVVTAGLGLGVAYGVTQSYPLTTAEAAQFRTTQLLGVLNVAGLTGGLDRNYLSLFGAQSQLIGLGLGTAGAAVLHSHLKLTEGQVALVTSSMVWAPYLVWHGLTMIGGPYLRFELYSAATPIAADLAVLATLILVQQDKVKLSRGRMALINLGGGLGLALAGTITVLAGGTGSEQGDSAALVAGALAGLAGGYLATAGWDARYNPDVLARSESPSLLAWEDGALKLGTFTPVLMPEARIRRQQEQEVREVGARVSVDLIGGRF